MNIEVPEKLLPLYTTEKRFIDIYGGRGGAKSQGVATFLLVKALSKKNRVLCTREVQLSIKDSVWQLLCEIISLYKWDSLFSITDKVILCKKNGSDFIFKGLHGNASDIRSIQGIQYAWVEEAQSVSRKSLESLVPTVRNPGSQIIFTYNPTLEEDPVHADYTLADRDDTLKIEINWKDNPWFPEVLKADMEYDRKTNYGKYLHIWEGKCEQFTNEQIGAFQSVPNWDSQYCVAAIDPSFSDRQGTDSTAIAIVGVSKDCMIFTGMLWPKSIADPITRREMLDFLSAYSPIETVLESQLSDSSIFFLDVLKREESIYPIKNLWTVKHQSRGKHERIMAMVGTQKSNLRILEGTQQSFSLEVSRYNKGAEHDDAPDVLALAIETLGTSEVVSEYSKAINMLNWRK
ncbi:MAG: PBSX family phage terminase large subunit [Ignavibacteria bacterium]|nr:PBSX family phage terminase large subunit [Ignavibacteria bacterium]